MSNDTEKKREQWEGGYIRTTKAGRKVFVIERWVGGRHYHVSTRCSRRDAAIKQLTRFEAAPSAFDPKATARTADALREPLPMSADAVLRFRKWQIDDKGNTAHHANLMANLLSCWMEDLAGTDLRDVTLRQLRVALDHRPTSQKHRIIAIKSFYGWLRKVRGVLTSADDPTLDLPVPQSRPEKWKRPKAVTPDTVAAVLATLTNERTRDAIYLLSATAWHVSELKRFAKGGDIVEPNPPKPDVVAVLCTVHKGGEPTRTPIRNVEHLECARRIRARGNIPNTTDINNDIAAAVLEHNRKHPDAPLERFTLGVMRHSTLTWAVQGGASISQTAEFAGHKDARTTRRFYVDIREPTYSPVLPHLRLA